MPLTAARASKHEGRGIAVDSHTNKSRSLFQKLLEVLDIKPGEGKIVGLALGATFFHGVSSIYLFSVSHSLFLASFAAKDLAYTYIGGAATVFIVGAAYAALQHRMKLANLVNATLAALLLTLIAARFWLSLAPPQGPAAFLAVWTVAYTTLTYMSIWGLFGQIFDTRQAKRLFGLIGAGEFAADILSGFVTPLVVDLIGSVNLLWVAAFGLFMSIVFTWLISRACHEQAAQVQSTAPEAPPARLADMFKERYPRLLHLLWGLSLMAFYLLDTGFSNAVENYYRDALDPMTSFLGVFFAVGSAVNMIVQTFVSGRFLSRVGIIKALFILPVGVLLGSLCIAGGQFIVPKAGLAMFIMAVGCKMFDYVLRNAIHDPAFQVLYQPLPLAKRFAVQSSVLTRAEPMAALAGGAVLLLGRLSFEVDVASVAVLMAIVQIVQVGFTFSLGGLYLKMLMEALKSRRFGATEDEIKDQHGVQYLLGFMESRHPGEVLYSLHLLERNAPQLLTARVETLLHHSSPAVVTAALALLERTRPESALPEVRRMLLDATAASPIRAAAVLAYAGIAETEATDLLTEFLHAPDLPLAQAALAGLLKHCGIEGIVASGERLMEMLRSEDPQRRKAAVLTLGEAAIPAFYRPLRLSLHDPCAEVRHAALISAEKLGNLRLVPLLIPHLASPQTRRLACKAIAAAGEAGLPELGMAMANPDLPREIALGCIKTAALISGQAATAFLVEHLFFPDVEARTLILARLQRLAYRPNDEEQQTLLKNLMDQEAAFAGRLLRCRMAIAGKREMDLLAVALGREYTACVNRLLALVSFTCAQQEFQAAQRCLREPGKEAYALEMLDAMIPEACKRLLFPLLEDASDGQRAERLEKLYPQKPLDLDAALAAVATMGRAWLKPWTRAVAAYTIGLRNPGDFAAVLTQAAASRDPMLAETAQWALRRILKNGE